MNGKSGSRALDMAAPATAFAAVFLWLRAANQTPDGLSYARAARTGLDMFHPHHLLYVPVARLIHRTAGVDALTAALWQNVFWLVVLALAAWRLAGRVLPGRWAPVLAAAALLSLRGVMIYTVRVETYLPALACLALATVLAGEPSPRRLLAAPVLALAVFYHQTNVLFVLPLLVLAARDKGRARRAWTLILAAAGLTVLAVYLVAARGAGQGFWAFALDYARAPIEAWGNFDHYSPGGVSLLVVSQLRMILPVRDAAAVPGAVAMLAVLVFLFVWHVRQIRRLADHLHLRVFSLVFLAVYLLFFLWWMPADGDFFLATVLPLWLLGVILVADLPPWPARAPLAAVLVLGLAAGNLQFTIGPMHRDPGPGRRLALALDRIAPPDAEFVVGYAVQQEMLYFTDRTRVHEGEGLWRAVLAGETPGSLDGPDAVVVIDGILLREVLDRDQAGTALFLRRLAGYDPGSGSARVVRSLADTDGIQLGPRRGPAGSWDRVEADLKAAAGR